MATWNAFPYAGDYSFDTESLAKNWAKLHRGDAEPLPKDPAVLQAWVHFHNGEFQKAAETGLQAGGDGITVANKATCIYANYLEPREKAKLDLLMDAATRAEAQQVTDPGNPNAWYWQAYALGRYAQGISVAKALAQGLGSRVKASLEHTIRVSPRHADAHIALATFHAEVIDKVGSLIGGMTYGAKKETGLVLFRDGLRLNPDSAVAMIEYANGLVMLEGEKKMNEATRHHEEAAASRPLDATERLAVSMAKTQLAD
ncbi:MAG: hypothetical protein EOO28_08535 [Comamonadaceae bacterium]|nr:MAG: hypothetical protein EOO28_08535 [Comamonadaceae bacterium]